MKEIDLMIIGGGPAGLSAAKVALEAGLKVMIVDRNMSLGGQLIKQTHKFFGSEKQYAKTRGFDIAKRLIDKLAVHKDNLEICLETTAVGLYKDYVVTTLQGETYTKYRSKSIIIATGASEKVLAFENNDLPGVYGAGAVQTLMNLYGVIPGKKALMVGSGNIGLIVSYQMMQAGIEVLAIVEAAPKIGGYKVHAAKIRRLGVPIHTSTTVKRAVGKDQVEAVVTVELDEKWKEIPGTEKTYETDIVCISVGLSPLHQLLSMAEIEMRYIPELGGLVPIVDEFNETSMEKVFVCGDVIGVEEASSAMVEGSLAGLIAAKRLGKEHPEHEARLDDYLKQLSDLRNGPFGI
ncbi:MAG: FAD-dependent oxidoreductase, partial [Bacilli bacterium]|nr:FAD-dependent oxidoreductase [Bacilli bacterium]